ncbi:MAG: 2OG-Fe(II) oxygenase [Blastocatellia bacterium]
MINLSRIAQHTLETEPYRWAMIDSLFSRSDAGELVATYPHDQFKTVAGYDGEKGYEYESRALIHMGSAETANPQNLSSVWRQLASDLVSPAYRQAMSTLTGIDLTTVAIEVNVFHYGAGSWLGPHVDLKDKIVTHVLYFNDEWNAEDGGCLTILRSSEMSDVAAVIQPVIGNSAVLVRSEKSWHAVSRVVEGCHRSRRSMTVTFYHPGSISTMWPPGDQTRLHDYREKKPAQSAWNKLRGKLKSFT